jgi:CheY-like chemotaxis protein
LAYILIVDDEPDLRFLLRIILEQAKHTVVEASQGEQALERAHEHRPELVMTDLMMPVMDGRELIRRLREDPDLRDVPVLLVTAVPEPTAGADAMVRKPFGPADVLDKVERTLGRTG